LFLNKIVKIVLKQISIRCEGLRVIFAVSHHAAIVSHFFAFIDSEHHFLILLLKFRLFNNNLRLLRLLLNKIVSNLAKRLLNRLIVFLSHGLDYYWHSRLS